MDPPVTNIPYHYEYKVKVVTCTSRNIYG